MTPELFKELVEKYGMKLNYQFNVEFSEVIDTVSVFEK